MNTRERIACLAYYLYEHRGGNDLDNWLAAEREVLLSEHKAKKRCCCGYEEGGGGHYGSYEHCNSDCLGCGGCTEPDDYVCG